MGAPLTFIHYKFYYFLRHDNHKLFNKFLPTLLTGAIVLASLVGYKKTPGQAPNVIYLTLQRPPRILFII